MEKLNAFVEKMPDFFKPWGEEMLLGYVDFQGKTDRKRFWTVFLLNLLVSFVLGLIAVIPIIGFVAGLASIALIVPGLAIYVRRLNDIGKPWPFIFFGLIPCVGSIILIVFACLDSAA